jgi:hypothetical protein
MIRMFRANSNDIKPSKNPLNGSVSKFPIGNLINKFKFNSN